MDINTDMIHEITGKVSGTCTAVTGLDLIIAVLSVLTLIAALFLLYDYIRK